MTNSVHNEINMLQQMNIHMQQYFISLTLQKNTLHLQKLSRIRLNTYIQKLNIKCELL